MTDDINDVSHTSTLAKFEESVLRAREAELAEWKQAASVEAGLRREFADKLASARKALEFIADGYENHNINHVDYRVKVYQVATETLEEISK